MRAVSHHYLDPAATRGRYRFRDLAGFAVDSLHGGGGRNQGPWHSYQLRRFAIRYLYGGVDFCSGYGVMPLTTGTTPAGVRVDWEAHAS